MKITAEPRSDQWNADDFVGSPRTFTIAAVHPGKAEQKYDIELVEGEGRVWRPPLTMLRLLIAAWGDEAAQWTGRRVTLYRDAKVSFGSDAVGGIRVSHMSNLPDGKPFEVRLTSSRGKRTLVRALPLPDAAPAPSEPTPDELAAQVASGITDSTTEAEVREWGNRAHARGLLDNKPEGSDATLREMVTARLAELSTNAEAKP